MADPGVHKVRLFVSSPGDVRPERDRVDRVVSRLNAGLQDSVVIETVRWEHQYYTADTTFQTQIADAGACDIVVSIFWQRLGTPLPADFERMPNGKPYPSGTVFEVMKAIEARTKSEKKLPDVLVYRKLADATAPIVDRERYRLAHEQRQAFLDFWDQWFFTAEGEFKAAYNTFVTTDAFEEKLEQHLRAWLTDHGFAARAIAWSIAEKGSPFRGLEAFGPADEGIFFGRERETARALERLGRAAARGCQFLLLIGESGCGKSSLARAGIAPKLLRGSLPGRIETWRYAEVRTATSAAIAAALYAEGALPELAQGDFNTPDAIGGLLATSGNAAATSVLRALDRVGVSLQHKMSGDTPVEVGLVLLLDQFETFFGGAGAERESIAQALLALARSGRVIVMATLRSDTYGRIPHVPSLLALKDAGETLDVAMPDAAAIADIVSRPAQIAGLAFGKDEAGQPLDETIIRAATGRDALPLVEFALARLYGQMIERLAGRGVLATRAAPADLVLAAEDYAAFGGLEGAVVEAAERAYATTTPHAQANLPRLLRLLAADAPDGAAQAGALQLADVDYREATREPGAEALVRALVDARILVLGGSENEPLRVRLAHEAVLRSWPRARDIVTAHANFFRVRADVTAAEQRWSRHQAEPGARGADAFLLPPGVPLAEAETMRRQFAAELSPALLAFIDRSGGRARRQVRRLIAASIVFALVAAGAAAAAGAAWLARNEAAANAALAQRNAGTALKNFHLAADQAEALVLRLGDKLKHDPGVSREALKTILGEGRREIDALAAQDPSDHYVAQVRAHTILNIIENFVDLGDNASAKALLPACVGELRSRPQETWDHVDRNIIGRCFGVAAKLAVSEGKLDPAIDVAEQALALAAENAKESATPLTVRNLGVAFRDVGDLMVRKGDLDGAEKNYTQSLELQRAMAKQSNDPQTRQDLAVALDRVGKMAALRDKTDDALADYREALDIVQDLARESPSDTALTESLSVANVKVGVELARGGRNAEAVDYFRQAVALSRQLVAQDATNWPWRARLVESLQELGRALVCSRKPDEGIPLLTESVNGYRALVEHDQKNQVWRRDLGMTLNTYALAIRATDRAGALAAAHESLDIFRALAAGDQPRPQALLDETLPMMTIADAGEETRQNYANVLAIYQSLDQRGALPPNSKQRMAIIQAYLNGPPQP